MPLRVCIVAPLVSPVRADAAPLGGAQSYLADLAQWLAQQGHTVVLLGARGSQVAGVETPDLGLDSELLQPARFDGSARSGDDIQTSAFQAVRSWIDGHAGDFDVIHAHAYDAPAFDALRVAAIPVVHTLHLPPVDPTVTDAVLRASATAAITTVSDANARFWRQAGVSTHVIPNGVDVDAIPFGPDAAGYVLFAGRISPEKGVDSALDVAREAGLPLVLAGGLYDRAYFDQAIAPRCRIDVSWRPGQPMAAQALYLGSLPRRELWTVMAHAEIALVPSRWDEPFGLVAIEAPASGCPVVASARGGLPEAVGHGISGFLVESESLAAWSEAARRARALDRAAAREWVRRHHGHSAMVRRYEDLYRQVVAGGLGR
jgi:glycosyltransferase involved in cell wall biosynthesis